MSESEVTLLDIYDNNVTSEHHYLWPVQYPPRWYLDAALQAVIEAVAAGKRVIVHLPTGTGKTVLAAAIIKYLYSRGYRTLFLHHRRELGSQTLAKFQDFGLTPEIEESSERAEKRSLNPVIASVRSLQGRRLQDWPPDEFRLILTDECHHAEAASYQNIYNHFATSCHAGLTATVVYDRRSLHERTRTASCSPIAY